MDKNNKFGVIFDMDGTLVNNAEYHKQAWIKFLEKHGIGISVEEYHKKLFGRTSKEILSIVFDRELSEEEKTRYTEEKEETYRDIYADKIKAQPGLMKLLDRLKAEGVQMGVATSATESNLKFTLEKLGIAEYFITTTNSSEIKHSKPHPEIFLKTSENLGMDASRCLVFEDSPPGVEAASKAGMKIIVVNPSEADKIRKYTDQIHEDFTNINYEKLLQIMKNEP